VIKKINSALTFYCDVARHMLNYMLDFVGDRCGANYESVASKWLGQKKNAAIGSQLGGVFD